MNNKDEDEHDELADNSWDDWCEDEDALDDSVCLVCDKIASTEVILSHLKHDHDFDFKSIKSKLRLDFYGCIKLINYIRGQVCLMILLQSYKLLTLVFWSG
jgi:type I protein arginine methyltransferase